MGQIPEDVSTLHVVWSTTFLLAHTLTPHLLMAKAWDVSISFVSYTAMTTVVQIRLRNFLVSISHRSSVFYL